MEIPTELQQSITKANQAVVNAQSDYVNMLANVRNLEAEYTKAFKQKNPTASILTSISRLLSNGSNHANQLSGPIVFSVIVY